MKKLILLLAITACLLSATAMAYPDGLGKLKITGHNNFRTILVEKNPVDWLPVEDGAYCRIVANAGHYMMLNCHGLEPKTNYTFIYYGDKTHNNVWPYATCIKEMTSEAHSGVITYTNIVFNYDQFLDDEIGQKFWLVKSDDVDCEIGKMIAWNPTEYLFEWDTI